MTPRSPLIVHGAEVNIQSIYSKLVMRVFDVHINDLKCMYSTRFNGDPIRSGVYPEAQSTSNDVDPLTLDTSRPDKYQRWRRESNETNDT